MKRYLISFLCICMVFSLTSCSEKENGQTNDTLSEEKQYVQSSENTKQENTVDDAFSPVQEPSSEDEDVALVYMTTQISAEGLMAVYEALDASPFGRIAVKLSTGEPGSNYLRTDLIGDFVMSFDNPTIVECNTAYGGSRANTAMHYQVAEDHGYTEIANVDIMDENGSMTLDVEGGDNLTENYVGENFANYDYYVILSHFKGHAMAGIRDEHGVCIGIYDHGTGNKDHKSWSIKDCVRNQAFCAVPCICDDVFFNNEPCCKLSCFQE